MLMKVSELIKQLQEFHPDDDVSFPGGYSDVVLRRDWCFGVPAGVQITPREQLAKHLRNMPSPQL
jgi:hypothetical protein